MDQKLKIGVIGVGKIAQVTHIPIWNKLENVEILAVCDKNKSKAKWLADKYNIKHVFDNAEALYKIEEISAVDICTPTQSHMDLSIAALSSGKHVLIEKPIARNFTESEKMVQCAKDNNKMLIVTINVRFRQDAMILKTFTQNGELGDIFYAKAGWLRRRESLVHKHWFAEKEIAGGGVFMDLGIQMLDVSLWLMGDLKAERVTASLYNNISGISVEDSAAVFIRL